MKFKPELSTQDGLMIVALTVGLFTAFVSWIVAYYGR